MPSEDARESSSAGSAIVIGVLIAVIPAIIGYVWSYADGIRKDRLAFTNDQIEKLYGPLHGLAQANDATWCQFTTSGNAPDWNHLTKENVTLWRVWMPKVLQPMNVKFEKTIVSNSQLLVGDKIPLLFQRIIAHTEAYRALISTWSGDQNKDDAKYTDKSQNTVEPPYPDNVDLCVRPIYVALKKQQETLQNNIFRTFSLEPLPNPPDCDKPSQNPHKCDEFSSALKRP